jgi:hypothetical protein
MFDLADRARTVLTASALSRLAMLLLLASCASQEKPAVLEQSFSTVGGINPLESCSTTEFSRFARGVECNGARLLFVSREPAPDALREHMQKALLSYGFTPAQRSLHVNGRDEPALEYVMGNVNQPVLHVLFTALAMPGTSESIEVQCYGFKERVEAERCQALLDGFIAQGLLRGEWPRSLSQSPRHESLTFDLAGRLVRLPASCSELSPFDIECQDGHVRVFVPNSPDKLAHLLEVDLAVTKDETMTREYTGPCALEGVETTCTLRRSRLPFSDELLSYRAVAMVRRQPVFMSCEVKASRAHPEPGPVCNQFFRFPEGVLNAPADPNEPPP